MQKVKGYQEHPQEAWLSKVKGCRSKGHAPRAMSSKLLLID